MEHPETLFFIAAFLVAVVLYFFPFLIAWSRHHKQITAVFWTNFFFGWTGIGWCLTFVWAVIK